VRSALADAPTKRSRNLYHAPLSTSNSLTLDITSGGAEQPCDTNPLANALD
jgi:hypothetical protein